MCKKLVLIFFFILLIINITSSYAYWASQVLSGEMQSTGILSIGTWTIATTYDFEETNLEDLIDEGASIVSGSFNDTDTSLQSNNGLLYIPNPLVSYTINVTAQILNSGSGGGYGILFDTLINNPSTQSDTGWALQFDRGYSGGEIIIRPRVNGSERSPVFRYGIRFDDDGQLTTEGGLKNNQNPWWMAEHVLRLEVTVLDAQAQQKRLTLFVDDLLLFTFDFISPIFEPSSEQNVTGLRTWSGVNIAFYELVIEP